MAISSKALKTQVQQAIDAYVLPDAALHSGVGMPLGREWYEQQLAELRLAPVEPYLARLRDEQNRQLVVLNVYVVLDDQEGGIVAYDVSAEEFVLVNRDVDPDAERGVDLVSCGIRGSAVDCFLSR